MIFCDTAIKPGTRKAVPLPVPGADALGTICFCGAEPGKTLVVTAGVHGCEYVGIEALRRLSAELNPAELSGNVILLPLANPSGFYSGARQIVPEDGINLNRAFPGDPKGSLSARLAFAIAERLYPAADFLADLHSGDCNEALRPLVFFPVAGEPAVNQAALAAAKVLTVPYRVASTARSGLYSWAVQTGVPALLIERGGLGLWSEEEVASCCEDIRSLLRHLGILPGENPGRKQTEITEAYYAEAESDGLWYPAAAADTHVEKDALLGRLRDFSGTVLAEIRAPFSGLVLYHSLSLGVRAGDPLIACGRLPM